MKVRVSKVLPSIQINPEWKGPTLLVLEPILEDVPDPLIIAWNNTRAEIDALRRVLRNLHRPITLVVKTVNDMTRTCNALGLTLKFDGEMLENCKAALWKECPTWRPMVEGIGSNTARSVLVKLVANALRQGKRPKFMASVMDDVLFSNVDPADTDVLARLRMLQSD